MFRILSPVTIMRLLILSLTFLMTACSTFSNQQTGDFSIHTIQMAPWVVKILPHSKETGYIEKGIVRIKDREGHLLLKEPLRRGQLTIDYPVHEAAIIIEIETTEKAGSKLFFRNELRDLEV